jgi:hypothetical protein
VSALVRRAMRSYEILLLDAREIYISMKVHIDSKETIGFVCGGSAV